MMKRVERVVAIAIDENSDACRDDVEVDSEKSRGCTGGVDEEDFNDGLRAGGGYEDDRLSRMLTKCCWRQSDDKEKAESLTKWIKRVAATT